MTSDEWYDFLANAKLIPGAGPRPSQIAIVGEAPGLNETIYNRPFVGEAGNELTRMLAEAGLRREDIYLTNVFKIKPPDTDRAKNDIQSFFVSGAHPDADRTFPVFGPNRYVRAPIGEHVRELFRELDLVETNIVVALGNVALWGLLGKTKISQFLGTVHEPSGARKFTVVPTYHPAAILRQYNLRTTTIANLSKVAGLVKNRKVGNTSAYPKYKIHTNPTIDEVEAFAEKASKVSEIAVDVETAFGQIRTIAFTISANQAFVVPIWEPPADSYWPTLDGELRAWRAIKRIMESPGDKIGQNILYDLQYLWRVHGIKIRGNIHDTMAWSHAAEPELPRTLGHLAATYLNMPEWKSLRVRSEKEEE